MESSNDTKTADLRNNAPLEASTIISDKNTTTASSTTISNVGNAADTENVVVVEYQEEQEEEEGNRKDPSSSSSQITPPSRPRIDPRMRMTILVIYGPLLVLSNLTWAIDTAYVKDNWECIACRADKDPTVAQQFLYYTVWNMWATTAILILWARKTRRSTSLKEEEEEEESSSTNKEALLLHSIFQGGFPLVTSVCIAYIYYTTSFPAADFVDEDVCHRMYRSFWSKDLEMDISIAAVNFYLVLQATSDLTIHWFSFPLLFYFWCSGQLQYTVCVPWSTIFVFLLSAVSSILQNQLGVLVYCGDPWFNSISMVVLNFVCCILFSLGSRGYLGFRNWPCVLRHTAVIDPPKEGVEESDLPTTTKL